jgi:phosphoglycolate phosphatase
MRTWDSYDAYLFDIDGTLLNCTDAVHYFAFCEALTAAAGRPLNLDGITTHGNVDVGILRDAFALNRVEDAAWRPRLPQIRASMGCFVTANRHDLRAQPLDGVVAVLEHLRSHGAVLGVATGNLEEIGWAKLDHCHLRPYFRFGGFSDLFEDRREVFRAAVDLARQHTHPNASICVVGDTPADIQAAHANSLDVIAVATGIFPKEELEAQNPTLCVRSLTELLSSVPAPEARGTPTGERP